MDTSVNQLPESFSNPADKARLVLRFGGGLNENTDPDINECSEGYNFVLGLNQLAFVPRAPFDLRGTAPNAGSINGILQLTNRAGTQTTLVQSGGTVYQWNGGATFTSMGSCNSASQLRSNYWSLGDYLVIHDLTLNNALLKWDGTTLSTLTHTGVSGTLTAEFALVHLNRLWLFNISANGTLYPHMILVCKFEDPTNWDIASRGGPTTSGGAGLTTGLEAFYLLTPDTRPINGAVFFQNTLIISTTSGRIFQLTGTSSKDFLFTDFFDTEPAIGTGYMASIGNDVIYLRRGGNLVLLFATQTYGNANVADLSMWLPTTARGLSQINAIVYDTTTQRVLVFIPNKVLVLYKDLLQRDRYNIRGGISPWSVYTTDDTMGFNVLGASYINDPGTLNYTTFFGDKTGRVFALDGVGSGDAGATSVRAYRRSRHIGTDVVDPWPWMQENLIGHVRYHRNTPVNFTVSIDWDDEYSTTQAIINLLGPLTTDTGVYFGGSNYFGGSAYFNQGLNAVKRIASISIDPGGKGPGMYISTYATTSAPFQVDLVEFD